MKFFKVDNFGTQSELFITENEKITKEQIMNELVDISIQLAIEKRSYDDYCNVFDTVEHIPLFDTLVKRIDGLKWLHLYDSNNDFELETIANTVNHYFNNENFKPYFITFMENSTSELKVKKFFGDNENEVMNKYNESYPNEHYTFISIGHLFE